MVYGYGCIVKLYKNILNIVPVIVLFNSFMCLQNNKVCVLNHAQLLSNVEDLR